MSYNVHRCVGYDRVANPRRIADVIAAFAPDVVALQELDVHRHVTDDCHQPAFLAEQLGMNYHFHPTFEVRAGQYGHAILSRYPASLVSADRLPPRPGRPLLRPYRNWESLAEPRGVMWLTIRIDDTPVQFLNTHLGLGRRERMQQIRCILGPEWVESALGRGPVLLCGDLNAGPRSRVIRWVSDSLSDVQTRLPGYVPRATFTSRLPLLRLDHVFVSRQIDVDDVQVPRNSATRIASDHLPLITDLTISTTS